MLMLSPLLLNTVTDNPSTYGPSAGANGTEKIYILSSVYMKQLYHNQLNFNNSSLSTGMLSFIGHFIYHRTFSYSQYLVT